LATKISGQCIGPNFKLKSPRRIIGSTGNHYQPRPGNTTDEWMN